MNTQTKPANLGSNIEPIKVVKSISRWIKTAIFGQSTVTYAQARTWAEALDHVAALLENAQANPVITDAPLDAAYAERLRHDAGWVVAELCTKANKFADIEEAKQNDMAAQSLLAALNALSIGICRPSTQIITHNFNGDNNPPKGA